jgi:Putative addiction module component
LARGEARIKPHTAELQQLRDAVAMEHPSIHSLDALPHTMPLIRIRSAMNRRRRWSAGIGTGGGTDEEKPDASCHAHHQHLPPASKLADESMPDVRQLPRPQKQAKVGFVRSCHPCGSAAMNIDSPLDAMSVAEKVQLLESVWQSLCLHSGDVASPEWHQTILEERRTRLEDGRASISSWADAKARLLQVGQ